MGTLESWDQLLDSIEAQLVRQEKAFQRGLPAPPPFPLDGITVDAPCDDLQAIRARALVARGELLADEVAHRLAQRGRR